MTVSLSREKRHRKLEFACIGIVGVEFGGERDQTRAQLATARITHSPKRPHDEDLRVAMIGLVAKIGCDRVEDAGLRFSDLRTATLCSTSSFT